MARLSLIVAVVLLSMTFAAKSKERVSRSRWRCLMNSFSSLSRCYTCNPFQPRKVTLTVRNLLKEPHFEETVVLKCTTMKTLFYMMQEAADINPKLKFSVLYNHRGHPGFFVNAFNYVYSTWDVDESWWQILDGDLKLTPVGVSFYVPKDGETVMFNLTQGFPEDY